MFSRNFRFWGTCFMGYTSKEAWGHTIYVHYTKHPRPPLVQREMMYHDMFITFCNRDVAATSVECQPRTLMGSIRSGQMAQEPCSHCVLQIDRWRVLQNVSDWLQHEFFFCWTNDNIKIVQCASGNVENSGYWAQDVVVTLIQVTTTSSCAQQECARLLS